MPDAGGGGGSDGSRVDAFSCTTASCNPDSGLLLVGYGLIADGAKGPGVGVRKPSDAAITLQRQDMCQQIDRSGHTHQSMLCRHVGRDEEDLPVAVEM